MNKTKPGPFDAALSLLEGAAFAIRGHAKDRQKALKDCREIANACIVLEAAGRVDKEKAERTELYGPAGLDIRVLLNALPDKEPK